MRFCPRPPSLSPPRRRQYSIAATRAGSKPSNPPASAIAASRGSCGASPRRTSFSFGGSPVLLLVMAEGAAGSREFERAGNLARRGDHMATPRPLAVDEPAADLLEPRPPEGT